VKWGKGRAWPLLTGERGHYELAAGNDPRQYLRAMEYFSNGTALLPEQISDEADLPDAGMFGGGPTGSANPLLWAHSEYLRLLRSCHDRKVFDVIPDVAARYQGKVPLNKIEYWLPKHPICHARRDHTLRICAQGPFRLHWSHGGTATWRDEESRPTGIGVEYVDLRPEDFVPHVEFTFFWKERDAWEGRNYRVEAY
jgi:glucoamylase